MATDSIDRPSKTVDERYRWIVLLICLLSFLVSFIDRLSWANVAVSAGASLGLSVAALGVFVTAFYVGYVVCNALGGVASDRIGGRLTLTARDDAARYSRMMSSGRAPLAGSRRVVCAAATVDISTTPLPPLGF